MVPFLRPPGVLSEKDLAARCISCGQCAQVCNYACLALNPDRPLGGSTPKIYQGRSPCFLCMKCCAVCPTNALREVTAEEAGMGRAGIDKDRCLNHRRQGRITCWTCYERCPLKGAALVLKNGYSPEVRVEKCAGCGVCEYVCPVAAISVTPTRLLPPAERAGGGL
jgi:ferredoxin-type protein NapG